MASLRVRPAVVSAVGRGAELADSLSGELQIQR